MRELTLFNVHHDCLTLSPVKSTVFYADGCNFRCKGCLYWEARETTRRFSMTVRDAAESVMEHGSECIVLSGGNPVLQAEAFLEMVESVRARKDVGLIVYCGETREELEALKASDPAVRRLIGQADIVISGRYVPELDAGNARVGSTNQNVDFLTDRYAGYEGLYEVRERRVEIELTLGDEPYLSYSGVPSPAQRRLFDELGRALGREEYPDDPGPVGIYSLTERTSMLAVDGEPLASVEFGEDLIRMDLGPVTDGQVPLLVDAFLVLMGGGTDV